MRVLMVSLDRTLLGTDYSGDVLERHQEYARQAGQLDIIVFSKKGFKKKEISPQLTFYPTNSSTKLNYIFDAYNMAKDIYWPDKFDLIVSQDPFLAGLAGWLIKKRFKIPLLIDFHGDFWQNKYWLLEGGRWWFNWFFLILSKFLVSGADGIRVVSSGIRNKLTEGGVDRKKIRVIPTPVNLEKFENFNQEKIKDLREKHAGKKILINVGRRDPAKDFKTLNKVVELIHQDYRNLVFYQIGADIHMKEDEKLDLVLMGKISQKELVDYYQTADVYISSSKHESFGKVLIEAMAAGLPIVATETTGSKEIIQDGLNGFLVPIGDSQALARKVLYLLNNPGKAKEMGENGRQMVRERFDWEKIIKEIISFWQDLCTS